MRTLLGILLVTFSFACATPSGQAATVPMKNTGQTPAVAPANPRTASLDDDYQFHTLKNERATELFTCAAKGAPSSCVPFEKEVYAERIASFDGIPTAQLGKPVTEAFEEKTFWALPCAEKGFAIAAKAAVAGECQVAGVARYGTTLHLDEKTRAALLHAVPATVRAYVKTAPASLHVSRYDVRCKSGGSTVRLRLVATGDATKPRFVDVIFDDATLPGGNRVCR